MDGIARLRHSGGQRQIGGKREVANGERAYPVKDNDREAFHEAERAMSNFFAGFLGHPRKKSYRKQASGRGPDQVRRKARAFGRLTSASPTASSS